MHIWLFDIDGVLVRAGGYRAAMRATINYFSRRMGLGDRAPDDQDIEFFEACGLINEWDSVPICVAALICEAFDRNAGLELSGDIDQTLAAVHAAAMHEISVDYRPLVKHIAEVRRDGEAPSRTALRLLLDEAGGHARPESQMQRLAACLQMLLADTDNLQTCPTTFIFQHYSLGSRLFAETFQRPAAFESESLLAEHDQPALTEEWRARVLGLVAKRQLFVSIFTARPSYPPREIGLPAAGGEHGAGSIPYGAYAPEAELAAGMVGLPDTPLIGYGRIQWLALQMGREAAFLVKPSPIQALAAVGAAMSGREQDSLLAAQALIAEGRLIEPLTSLRDGPVSISVFEDTFGGIQSVREAAGLLRQHGVQATAAAYGVAASEAKQQVMTQLGAPAYLTFSLALEAACRETGICA